LISWQQIHHLLLITGTMTLYLQTLWHNINPLLHFCTLRRVKHYPRTNLGVSSDLGLDNSRFILCFYSISTRLDSKHSTRSTSLTSCQISVILSPCTPTISDFPCLSACFQRYVLSLSVSAYCKCQEDQSAKAQISYTKI